MTQFSHVSHTPETEKKNLLMKMSGKAKRRDDDGASDTDSDSEGHVSPKKSLKKDSDDDPDSITVCEVDFSLYYSISRISLFSFSFYLLFFYCVLITFCLR